MCVSESLTTLPAIDEAITAGSGSESAIVTSRLSKLDVVAASRLATNPAVQRIKRVFKAGKASALYGGKYTSCSGLIAIFIPLS